MTENRKGLLYGIFAFLFWGFLTLYWKLLDNVPSDIIFASRMFWSAIFLSIYSFASGKWIIIVKLFKNPKKLIYTFITAVIISINWYTYIWAVNAGYVLETSLGYYINPLVNVIFGVIFLKEKLNKGQIVAIIFAAIGVLISTIDYGNIPIIAITLSISFALYGLFKKLGKLDALASNTTETMFMTIPAMAYLLYKGYDPVSVGFSYDGILLVFTGMATAVPLLFFSEAAKRLDLSTMGFLQYIAPTIQFFLAIFLFKESISIVGLASFIFIWIGLVIYSYSQFRKIPQ